MRPDQWGAGVSSKTPLWIICLLLLVSVEKSAVFPNIKKSLKYVIIHSSNWFFPLFKGSIQIAFLAGLENSIDSNYYRIVKNIYYVRNIWNYFIEKQTDVFLCPALKKNDLCTALCNSSFLFPSLFSHFSETESRNLGLGGIHSCCTSPTWISSSLAGAGKLFSFLCMKYKTLLKIKPGHDNSQSPALNTPFVQGALSVAPFSWRCRKGWSSCWEKAVFPSLMCG